MTGSQRRCPSRPLLAGLLFWALLAPVLAAAGNAGGTALKTNSCTPIGGLRGNAEHGATLHLKRCAQCHGSDGKSEVLALHMEVPPKDQSDPGYMKTVTDDFIYIAICKGGEAVGRDSTMPAWGDVLTDQDIRDLVAYIRTFSGT